MCDSVKLSPLCFASANAALKHAWISRPFIFQTSFPSEVASPFEMKFLSWALVGGFSDTIMSFQISFWYTRVSGGSPSAQPMRDVKYGSGLPQRVAVMKTKASDCSSWYRKTERRAQYRMSNDSRWGRKKLASSSSRTMRQFAAWRRISRSRSPTMSGSVPRWPQLTTYNGFSCLSARYSGTSQRIGRAQARVRDFTNDEGLSCPGLAL